MMMTVMATAAAAAAAAAASNGVLASTFFMRVAVGDVNELIDEYYATCADVAIKKNLNHTPKSRASVPIHR